MRLVVTSAAISLLAIKVSDRSQNGGGFLPDSRYVLHDFYVYRACISHQRYRSEGDVPSAYACVFIWPKVVLFACNPVWNISLRSMISHWAVFHGWRGESDRSSFI